VSKTITYVCPSPDRPAGGVRVIYRHAELIERCFAPAVRAQVFHPQDPHYRPGWFEHRAAVKMDRQWAPATELAIVPEVWAGPLADQYRAAGVTYGVFVQNGYSINWHGTHADLHRAYAGAAVILTISEDATRCIETAFPDQASKVIELQWSIDAARFHADAAKDNAITYMPRKMGGHADLVRFFLTTHLPGHWTVQAIDGVDEAEVARRLNRSRIFLAFSELEGLPLPPVEAAFAGNHVIGYTGEGAKEYWDRDIFTEIGSGDIKGFVAAIRDRIARLDGAGGGGAPDPRFLAAVDRLRAKYSEANEVARLARFVDRVASLFP
jgi:glycosyltransferase involved in cell wall biosynthesis